MKTKNFRQKITVPGATAKAIYEALMDSKKHTEFTGDKAKISAKVGGAVSSFSGYAVGKNIELVPNKKIVQTWRVTDGSWPEGHDSEITFELKKAAKGAEIHFTHRGVPEGRVAEFKEGWKDFYWRPVKKYFKK